MVKTGVVEGTVKTAEADNKGDPIGTAAKCIAAAKESMSGLAAATASLKGIGKKAEKDKTKADK